MQPWWAEETYLNIKKHTNTKLTGLDIYEFQTALNVLWLPYICPNQHGFHF